MKNLFVFICLLAITLGAWPARKAVWVIDAGHGGYDTGCEGTMSREKDITLSIAKELGRLIKQNISDVRVIYTREKDRYPTLPERCALANAKGAQLFISIHVNDAENKFASGTESYFATNVPQSGANTGKSELLALLLQRQYLANGRGVSRGVKQEALYVCEHTNMPSVLTEVGFISNLEEERFMNSKEGQAILARSIYEAMAEWKKLTDNGLDRKTLRNLRYAYFAPRREVKPTPTVTVIKESKSDTKQLAQNLPAATPAKEPAKENTKEIATDATKEKPVEATKEVVKEAPKETVKETAKEVNKETAATASAPEREGNTTVQAKATKVTPAASTQQTEENLAFKAERKADGGKPVYSIQIMTLSAIIAPDDYRLKGETAIRFVQVDDRYKLLIGAVSTYQDAKNLLAQVREKFPDAFIVAYVDNRQVTTADAVKLEREH